MLIEQLRLDPGYLSRMLKRFEKLELTYRIQSKEDGRSALLYLSEFGKEALGQMNLLSDEQIRNMISELPEQSQRSIAKSMTVIERELTGKPTERRVHIRTELKPGDIGALIQSTDGVCQ